MRLGPVTNDTQLVRCCWPVSSNGLETHAKQLALSYAFDLWRVFQQCCQNISTTFYSKSSRARCCRSLILARVLECILTWKIIVLELQTLSSRTVRFRYALPLSVKICSPATHTPGSAALPDVPGAEGSASSSRDRASSSSVTSYQ